MKKLNTHYYDGKISWKYSKLKESLKKDGKEIIPLDQCWSEIEKLITEQTKKKSGQRKKAIMILGKLQSSSGNYDSANKIHVRDLIPPVWTRVREYELSGQLLFLEQLIDITKGMCPQGRVTRLLQVVETK